MLILEQQQKFINFAINEKVPTLDQQLGSRTHQFQRMVNYKIESKFRSNEHDKIELLRAVLVNECGYKHEIRGNQQVFIKGHTWSNFIQISPAYWKSEIIIYGEDVMIKGDLNVSTVGQIVTSKEKEYWDKFHQEIVKLLNNEEFDLNHVHAISKSASLANIWKILILILIVIFYKCS